MLSSFLHFVFTVISLSVSFFRPERYPLCISACYYYFLLVSSFLFNYVHIKVSGWGQLRLLFSFLLYPLKRKVPCRPFLWEVQCVVHFMVGTRTSKWQFQRTGWGYIVENIDTQAAGSRFWLPLPWWCSLSRALLAKDLSRAAGVVESWWLRLEDCFYHSAGDVSASWSHGCLSAGVWRLISKTHPEIESEKAGVLVRDYDHLYCLWNKLFLSVPASLQWRGTEKNLTMSENCRAGMLVDFFEEGSLKAWKEIFGSSSFTSSAKPVAPCMPSNASAYQSQVLETCSWDLSPVLQQNSAMDGDIPLK